MARKKIVTPTAREQKIINARLRRMYPQMFEAQLSARERKTFAGLSVADRKALESMVGTKLKKIYRKK